jgi:hypothetical protein
MSISNLSGLGEMPPKGNKIYTYSITDAGERGFEGFYSCYLSFNSAIDFTPYFYSSFIDNYINFLEEKGEYSRVEQYHTPCNGHLTTGRYEGETITITNVDEINEFAVYRDNSTNRWLLQLYQYQPQKHGSSIYSNPVLIAAVEPSFVTKFVQGV